MKMLLLALLLLAGPAMAKDKTPPPAAPIVASVDGLPIGALPKQDLPAKGCAAYLWTRGPSQALIAMAVADPATIRLTIDGKVQDFALSRARRARAATASRTPRNIGAATSPRRST